MHSSLHLSVSIFFLYLLYYTFTDWVFVTPTVFVAEPHLFSSGVTFTPGYMHVGLKCHGNIPKQPQAKNLQKQQGGNDKTESTNYHCSADFVFDLIQCFLSETQE